MNIQGWFSLGLTGWVSLQSKGLSRVFANTSSKASVLQSSAFLVVQLSHLYMTTGKTIALTIWTFVNKVIPLIFNMLSGLVIAFLPRSKCLLISWLQSLSEVILDPKKIKSVTVPFYPPSICHEVVGPDAMFFTFWMLSFKQLFHSTFSPSWRVSLVPLRFLLEVWCHLHIWGYWYFSQQSWFSLWFIQPRISHYVLCI